MSTDTELDCGCSMLRTRHSVNCPVSPGEHIKLPSRKRAVPIRERRPIGSKIPKSWKRYGG